MKSLKRVSLFLLSALLIFVFFKFFIDTDTRQFQELSKELLYNELSGNTINLHYTLAYPKNYDLEIPAHLPSSCSEEGTKEQILLWQEKLAKINPKKLNSQDQYAYTLFSSFLETALSGTTFPYYYEPLSPSSGMISGIPILLADYTFRNEKDVTDYLELLDQTDSYFDGLIAYEQEKSAAGLFMSDGSAEKIIEECYSIMDTNALAYGEHFLQKTFEARLDELAQSHSISTSQKEKWISENNRLLTTVMAPSYERVADAFLLLKGTGTNTMGLYYYPEGKEYYAYLLRSSTGSSHSISEIKEMLEKDFQKNWDAMKCLLLKHPDLLYVTEQDLLFPSGLSSLSEPDARKLSGNILEDLQKKMNADFPNLTLATPDFSVDYTIKKVSPSMEDFSSPAYYLTPPMDDMCHNTIYINRKSITDDLSLYTTLAHEGYPGHLYQTIYSQSFLNSQNASYIRSLLHYGGFVEGWALYVENLSYSYAQELLANNTVKGSPENVTAFVEACRLNRNLHLCLYSYLDIAIHYEGASQEQMEAYLKNLGLIQSSSVTTLYEYLVEEPTNYLKYYLGYLEFLDLKENAQELWGSDYSDYEFHRFILETGPSDFSSLATRLSSFHPKSSTHEKMSAAFQISFIGFPYHTEYLPPLVLWISLT